MDQFVIGGSGQSTKFVCFDLIGCYRYAYAVKRCGRRAYPSGLVLQASSRLWLHTCITVGWSLLVNYGCFEVGELTIVMFLIFLWEALSKLSGCEPSLMSVLTRSSDGY